MPAPGQSRAQHQILDGGLIQNKSVAASTAASPFASGTEWPLLPNTAVRVYHCSLNVLADVPDVFVITGANVQCTVEDSSGAAVNGSATLFPACGVWPDKTFVGTGAGVAVGASGDPLFQLAAGFLVAGATASPPSKIQFFAGCDVLNTDAGGAHLISIFFAVLMSFVQLS